MSKLEKLYEKHEKQTHNYDQWKLYACTRLRAKVSAVYGLQTKPTQQNNMQHYFCEMMLMTYKSIRKMN